MKKDGGTAFPAEQSETQGGTWNQTFDPGMSLRDWFAGQAMVGVQMAQIHGATVGKDAHTLEESDTASAAYAIADAMLKERESGGDGEA